MRKTYVNSHFFEALGAINLAVLKPLLLLYKSIYNESFAPLE